MNTTPVDALVWPHEWAARWIETPDGSDTPCPIVFDTMTEYTGPYCGAVFTRSQHEVCTRPMDHGRRHAAANGDGFVIAVWWRS